MRRKAWWAAAATTLVAATMSPAQASTTEVLHGAAGAADRSMFLTYVACGAFFDPASAPRTRVNLGPGAAPLGARSVGLVPTTGGTASGPFVAFGSLAGADTGLAVSATGGTSGASYVWYSSPDAPAGQAWSGRAEVTVPAGGWHQVEAADLQYTWTRYDLATRRPVAQGGAATPAEFAAAHGDGPGYVVTGFGCDGRSFNVDAVRAGQRVFDFEGITLTTAITASAAQVRAGDRVTVTGSVRDASGRTTGDPLQLQARSAGGEWRAVGTLVLAGPDGVARTEVVLDADTELRWHRPQGQYADEGWSDVVLVRVEQPVSPTPTPAPAPEQPEDTQQPAPQQPAPSQPAPSTPAPSTPAPSEPAPSEAPEGTTASG